MDNVLPPIVKRTLVLVGVRKGQQRMVRQLAPVAKVIREEGKPPRIEFLVPPTDGPRAA